MNTLIKQIEEEAPLTRLRVQEEQIFLKHKIDKLNNFIELSPVFLNLDEGHKFLLKKQLDVMNAYSTILALRMAGFEE